MEAMEEAELLHTPPAVVSVSVVEVLIQTDEAPPITPGTSGTVITETVLNWLMTPQLFVTE